jgi:hypothetical protein
VVLIAASSASTLALRSATSLGTDCNFDHSGIFSRRVFNSESIPMTDLINKTVGIPTSITLCKPDIYSLDITSMENRNKQLCVSHIGEKLISFELNQENARILIDKLAWKYFP